MLLLYQAHKQLYFHTYGQVCYEARITAVTDTVQSHMTEQQNL